MTGQKLRVGALSFMTEQGLRVGKDISWTTRYFDRARTRGRLESGSSTNIDII